MTFSHTTTDNSLLWLRASVESIWKVLFENLTNSISCQRDFNKVCFWFAKRILSHYQQKSWAKRCKMIILINTIMIIIIVVWNVSTNRAYVHVASSGSRIEDSFEKIEFWIKFSSQNRLTHEIFKKVSLSETTNFSGLFVKMC